MAVPDDLNIIKNNKSGERVAGAIASAMRTLNEEIYTEADIDAELSVIEKGIYGRDIKAAIYDGLDKLSDANPSYYVSITKMSQTSYNNLNPPTPGVLYGISDESMITATLLDDEHEPTSTKESFLTLGELRAFLNTHEKNLYRVRIGSMVDIDSIPEAYFSGRPALYSIYLGDNVKTIYGLAFYSVPNLTLVGISSGTTIIDEDAFKNCTGVTFDIDKPTGSISGAPWGATNSTVNWND